METLVWAWSQYLVLLLEHSRSRSFGEQLNVLCPLYKKQSTCRAIVTHVTSCSQSILPIFPQRICATLLSSR